MLGLSQRAGNELLADVDRQGASAATAEIWPHLDAETRVAFVSLARERVATSRMGDEFDPKRAAKAAPPRLSQMEIEAANTESNRAKQAIQDNVLARQEQIRASAKPAFNV